MDPRYYYIIVFSFFVATVLFSLLINRLFLKFSKTLGIRNISSLEMVRWSPQAKPSVGGISFYIIFLLSITAYVIFFEEGGATLNLPFLGILSSITLAFIIGLADDAYNTNPLAKFMGQLTCGILLSITGTNIQLFDHLLMDATITVFWVITLMNSLNMLDNMDAITAVVSLFIILGTLICWVYTPTAPLLDLMLMLGALGALLGFLYYNWNPAKIYMGDTGSQFIGCLLSIISIKYFWNFNIGDEGFISRRLVITALVFLIPLSDTTIVVINRIRRGQSPFVGGKDHTTHFLSYIGLSDKQVALLFMFLSVVSLFFVYLIVNFIKNWNYLYFALFSGFIILVAGGLFAVTQKKTGKTVHSKNPEL